MSKPVNKTAIGIFIVVAIALVVGAILVLGSGKFFKDNPKYVMYFDGSVKGLQVGSPVVFRGVKIGNVTEIMMLFNPKDLAMMIPVYVELGEGFGEVIGPKRFRLIDKKKFHQEFSKRLIEKGLRARLEMQSIVTGQLEIDMDFYPDKEARLIGADRRYPEIPTIPTTLQQLAERVEKIPIEEIFNKVRGAVDGIDRMVNSSEMKDIMKSLVRGLDETRELVRNMDGQIKPMASSITKTSDEAAVTLKKAQTAVSNIENLTGEDSAVVYNLTKTLNEIGAATRSLRLLADTLHHQPDSVIFGKKNAGGK